MVLLNGKARVRVRAVCQLSQGNRAVLCLTLAASAACADSPSEAPLTPDQNAAAVTSALAGLLTTVVAPDGKTAVAFATVRAYGIRSDGTVGPMGHGITDAEGKTTIQLPPGKYCLSARTAPTAWIDGLDIVTPAEPFTYSPIPVVYGPVVNGTRGYVPFTQAAFDNCYTSLPVKLGSSGAKETVKMAAPFKVRPEVLDLNGQPLTGVEVYAVIPATAPWATGYPAGIQTAFFSQVDRTESPADLVVSSGAPYALEFQELYAGFNVTGTKKGTAGAANGTETFTMEAAPLMCQQTTEDFPAGEPGIDFVRANYGYHASLGLGLDATTFALQLKHTGTGPVTVTFRTDLPMGRWTTTVSFSCAGGSCSGAKFSNSGGNSQVAQIFHAPKDGGVKTTIVLSGISSEHLLLLFAAKTPGDAVPLTSRSGATDAFIAVARPASACVVQESNDDKWGVAPI
jgi:hypothetical protein